MYFIFNLNVYDDIRLTLGVFIWKTYSLPIIYVSGYVNDTINDK